ncbi:hypothetical protein LINPERHAP1_LOCUS22791 [Linum perenne]
MNVVALLLDLATNERRGLVETEDVHRSLPHDREVYRLGFLFSITRANDVNCLSMLRMTRHIFWKLCKVLVDVGGLRRTKNIEVDEMVAMFLLTIGHNAKNRTCQVLLHRLGETVSRTIKCVLVAILNLDVLLLAKPIPVPEECTDHRWKYFKGCVGALDGTLVSFRTTTTTQARYRTRKGTTAINCLGVIN